MSWVIFSFLSALLISIVSLIEKYIVDKKIRDPITVIGIGGIGFFFLTTIVALIYGEWYLPLKYALLALLTGALHMGGLYFYYRAMKTEDISTIIPILSLVGVFILLMEFIFLGVKLTSFQYVGCGLVILGSFVISMKKIEFPKFNLALILLLFTVVLFSIRAILSKFLINNISVLAFMFWFGVAELIFGVIFLVFARKIYRIKALKGIKLVVLIGILAATAYMMFFIALVSGEVSLVSTLFQFSMLFTFVGAYLITIYHPKIINEKINKEIIILKIIAILIIFIGGYLIVA